MKKVNTDPAFPSFQEFEHFNDDFGRYETEVLPVGGMTKREYIATQVLPAFVDRAKKTEEGWGETCVDGAVRIADMLLERLKK